MRVVVQRVSKAKVEINGLEHNAIGKGLLLLVGVHQNDTKDDLAYIARKVLALRIFDDESGVMNRSIQDVEGQILSISQFTLLANTKKGNRPSYIEAAHPDMAIPFYEEFNSLLKESSLEVKDGVFGADMQISLVNDGPVTILLDTQNK